MARERVVDVYIPVVPPAGGGGLGGVGVILGAIGVVVVFAALVCIGVERAYPAPKHIPVPQGQCAPFCAQDNPVTTATLGGGSR